MEKEQVEVPKKINKTGKKKVVIVESDTDNSDNETTILVKQKVKNAFS